MGICICRNAKSSFINAHVYPGGVVDKADHHSHWQNIISKSASEKEYVVNRTVGMTHYDVIFNPPILESIF